MTYYGILHSWRCLGLTVTVTAYNYPELVSTSHNWRLSNQTLLMQPEWFWNWPPEKVENQQKRGFNHKNNDGKNRSFINFFMNCANLSLTAPHAPSATQSPTASPDYQRLWIHGSMGSISTVSYDMMHLDVYIAGWFRSAIPTTCDVAGPLWVVSHHHLCRSSPTK